MMNLGAMMPSARRIVIAAALAAAAGLNVMPARAAGYGYDPSALLDDSKVNIYFGSARTTKGKFVANTTVILESAHNNVTYVATTDPAGRYRLRLPRDVTADTVSARSAHRQFRMVQAVRRLPPGGATTPVEIDFILEPAR